MYFITYRKNGQTGTGVMSPDLQTFYPLPWNDMLEAIADEQDLLNAARQLLEQQDSAAALSLSDVELLAPIPRPRKNIFCLGKNYADHAIEMGGKESIPEHPMVFSKAPTSVTGPEHPIDYNPEITQELDYEGELALIIGKQGKGISPEQADDYIFGYTILNDVTARDLQQRHKQFLLGKSQDTFCPMGPYLVHKSAIGDSGNLNITTRVNGEIRQQSNTRHFIFDIPTILATISAGITLEAGDIISTGTPAGVGKGFKPPRLLKDGDVVEIEIEKIGILRNRVRQV